MTIKETLEKFNIPCSQSEEKLLSSYMEEILEKNQSINLTAIKERQEFILKHYVDSLSVIGLKEYEEAGTVIDIGTGGGFPGVPLAIKSPEKQFLLLDSLEKRLKIIDEILLKLGVKNAGTLHVRAEDGGKDPKFRENFDLCVSRAVADLSVLSEYCLPFVKIKGSFIAYKGMDSDQEIEKAERAIKTLGGEIVAIRETITNQRLVVISKVKPTPNKYPRKAGDPKRKPL